MLKFHLKELDEAHITFAKVKSEIRILWRDIEGYVRVSAQEEENKVESRSVRKQNGTETNKS